MSRLRFYRYSFFYIELILDEMINSFFCPEFCDEHQSYLNKAYLLRCFANF